MVMETSHFLELFIFSMIACVTPGPNNVLVFIYGLRFGWKTAVIFQMGVLLSAPVINGLVTWTLVPFFETYPILLTILTYISMAFVCYIAYRIITSNPDIQSNQSDIIVIGFWGSVFFQWINGKVWSMSLVVSTLFTNPDVPAAPQAFAVFVAFFVSNALCFLPWLFGGLYFRSYFERSHRMQIFNYCMGIGLVITAVYSAFGG